MGDFSICKDMDIYIILKKDAAEEAYAEKVRKEEEERRKAEEA